MDIQMNSDIVALALKQMTEEKILELAYKTLERQMKDVLRRPSPFSSDRRAAKVLHAAKKHMGTEKSLEFATAIFEATGLDTRDTKMVYGPSILTLEEILRTTGVDENRNRKGY